MFKDTRFTKSRQRTAAEVVEQDGLPHDEYAERALLGSIFIWPDVFEEVAKIVRADDFFNQRNRFTFEAMTRLHRSGRPIDPVVIIGELQDVGTFDPLGDGDGVAGIDLEAMVEAVPSGSGWPYYAQRVHEMARRRRLMLRGLDLVQTAGRSTDPRSPVVRRRVVGVQQ